MIEACIRNREWERAEKLMTGVPSRPAYTLFRGDILLAKGDEDGAVKIWTELADSLTPQEKTDGGLAAWTYYQAAERLNGIGRAEDAIHLYEFSYRAAVEPKPLDSLYARAFLLEKLWELPEAADMWQKIIHSLMTEYHITAGETLDWPKRELARLRNIIG